MNLGLHKKYENPPKRIRGGREGCVVVNSGSQIKKILYEVFTLGHCKLYLIFVDNTTCNCKFFKFFSHHFPIHITGVGKAT